MVQGCIIYYDGKASIEEYREMLEELGFQYMEPYKLSIVDIDMALYKHNGEDFETDMKKAKSLDERIMIEICTEFNASSSSSSSQSKEPLIL